MATSWVLKSTETNAGTYGTDAASRNYALSTTETTELAVNDWVLANASNTFVPRTGITLYLEKFKTAPLGGGIWDVTIEYAIPKFENQDASSDGPITTYDGGTSTAHVNKTITNQLYFTRDGETAPSVRNSINVTAEGVQGVDILTPTASFTIEKTHDAGTFTADVLRDLYLIQCSTNDDDWKGFQRGEVLFESFQVTYRGDGKQVSRAKFLVSPNDFEITIDAENDDASDEGITMIPKYGWQYLWELCDEKKVDPETTGAGLFRKRTKAVFVGDVYYENDFTLLDFMT